MADELTTIRDAIPFAGNGADLTEDYPGVGHFMFRWLTSGNQDVPPYWSRARDRWLREFVAGADPIKVATNTFVNKVSTIPWAVQPKDRSNERFVRMADTITTSLRRNSGSMSSTLFKGFRVTMKMFVKDYLTQDNGAFMQVLGDGPLDGPIIGPPLGLMHMDSALCTRTKDLEYPVKYLNVGRGRDGKEYKIHYTRIIEMANLPSAEVDLNGVGFCAVSCCIAAAQELWDVYTYSSEMFGSRPPKQILYAETGATVKNMTDAVDHWNIKLDNENRQRFGGTLILAPRNSNQELRLKMINLNALPENFERRDVTTIDLSMVAASFGLDLRDLAYTLGAPSRTGDAEVQDRKGRGKGVGEFIETFTERFNEVAINAENFEFVSDYLDDEQDEQQSNIRDKRSQGRERDLRAGVTTIRVERERMVESGEISREQFEDMELLDGRLPDGLDVLLLFQSQDADYKQWLDVGVADPTDIAANDAEKMADTIHQKHIEVSEYIHQETRSARRRKARQALAALEKLRSMYQTPEGAMLDEQAMLEAGQDGAEQVGDDSAPAAATEAPEEEDEDDDEGEAVTKELSDISGLMFEYERQFQAFVEYAVENDLPRERFEELMRNLVAGILTSIFLLGSRRTEQTLTDFERSQLNAEVQQHWQAISGLSDDIYSGRYGEDRLGLQSAFWRISGWMNIATGVYFLGLLNRPDDPYLRWVYSPFKDHCADCRRLDLQVHRASEWRAARWWPRSWRLECHGIHCGCYLVEDAGPAAGNF